jgi:hypothetical protein
MPSLLKVLHPTEFRVSRTLPLLKSKAAGVDRNGTLTGASARKKSTENPPGGSGPSENLKDMHYYALGVAVQYEENVTGRCGRQCSPCEKKLWLHPVRKLCYRSRFVSNHPADGSSRADAATRQRGFN